MCSIIFKLFLRATHVQYGNNLKLKGLPCIIRRNGDIKIGDNVTINSNFLSNLTGINHRTIIITRLPEAVISIGNNVGISGATIYARSSIFIGNNVLIGSNVKILDSDFHPLDATERANNDKQKIVDKPIYIGDNCFIGLNSIILKGTELGRGCIVGAGAVVQGKYKPGSVIVGNPGRVIRTCTEFQNVEE